MLLMLLIFLPSSPLYSPAWALASSTISLHFSLSFIFFIHCFIFISFRSATTTLSSPFSKLFHRQILLLCFRASQYRLNKTPSWCYTVQVLFLQTHSTWFGRQAPIIRSILKLARRSLVRVFCKIYNILTFTCWLRWETRSIPSQTRIQFRPLYGDVMTHLQP